MKRIAVLFLVVCLAVSACSVGVSAAQPEQIVYSSVKLLPQGEFSQDSVPVMKTAASAPMKKALRSTQKSVYETLRDGFVAHQDVIDISAYQIPLNQENVQQLYTYTLNYYPECIAVGEEIGIGYDPSAEAPVILAIAPEYTYTAEEYPQIYAEYRTMLDALIASVPTNLSDLEKAVYVHDYFVVNCQADMEQEISDVYRFLKQKKGVCQAYTLAYMAVMRGLGFECYAAVNIPQRHVWNVIKIGENYYHIDLMQDDPTVVKKISETSYIGHAGFTGKVMRDYLLVSDTKIPESGSHNSWEIVGPAVSCTDTSYDAHPWRNISSSLCLLNGRWYGIGVTGKETHAQLLSFGRDFSGTAQSHRVFSSYWSVGAPSDSYLSGAYSGLFGLGDTLYFNESSSLWSYSVRTKTASKVLTPTLSGGGQVFGLHYAGNGKIEYSVCTDLYKKESFGTYRLPMGDTNGDSAVTAVDLVNVRKYLLSVGTVNFNYGLIDLDEDGKITVIDLVKMKKLAV